MNKSKLKDSIKLAFTDTIPVLAGYGFLGAAYGILMSINRQSVWMTLFMSLIVFAGSLQFLAIALLTSIFNPLNAFLISIMLNVRHLFYSISMLEKYKGTSPFKTFLIFALTDETFSILCHKDIENKEEKKYYCFAVSFLNYLYWCTASLIGSLIGGFIKFETKGLDFVLTALFVVMFLEQWLSHKKHFPSVLGVLSSIVSLFIFGEKMFITFSMIIMLIVFTIFYYIKPKTNAVKTNE